MNKRCTQCKELRLTSEFHRDKSRQFGLSDACKKCNKERASKYRKKNLQKARSSVNKSHKKYYKSKYENRVKEWRSKNKHRIYFYQTKHQYGITEELFKNLLLTQRNKCATCLILFEGKIKACVDHNHLNGKVRGLLCKKCNSAIGFAQDDSKILERMADYVRHERDNSSTQSGN